MMRFLLSYKGYLLSLVAFCLLVSLIYYQNLKECSSCEARMTIHNSTTEKPSEIKTRITEIFKEIDQRIPKVTFTHIDQTTSAKKSAVFIKNVQNRYCVGDQLTVQVDVYDYLGKRKTYGGDYLRSRIFNPEKKAGSSGRVEDFNNGTYHIHFTLFWAGKVMVTIYLMHPSEAASALWKARNSWYGNVGYAGKFTREGEEMETKCGFDLDDREELCEYADHEHDEYFYCVKPKNFTCDSYTEFKNWKTLDTYLSKLENSLLTTSNVRVEIPVTFPALDVVLCNSLSLEKKENCTTGMGLEYPSGHVMEEIWYPKACRMKTYHSTEEMNSCMKGRFLYMYGDSTMHQWMTYFENKLQNPSSKIEATCKTGMGLEYPSGHVMDDIWYPKSCRMKTYHSTEELNTCMKGKFLYMFGDSTMHQWMTYFENKLKNMTLMNVYEIGWAQKHLGVDLQRNIHIVWKRHARPFIYLGFVSLREERTIAREIDLIGGNQHTVIALNIGIHFRLFPAHHYIRRLLNIRRSIERLLLRSPKTKVIIKTENTSEMGSEYEGMSDFHAYVHYAILEIVFKGVNVGFVNGWDMTTAFNTNQIHPPEYFIKNEINMLMTYICS